MNSKIEYIGSVCLGSIAFPIADVNQYLTGAFLVLSCAGLLHNIFRKRK